MKKVFIMIFLMLLLTACSGSVKEVLQNTSDDEKIAIALTNLKDFADKNLSPTSDISSYVKGLEYSKDYRFIVSKGEKSLNIMLEKFSGSNKDGINEYIMAAACCEILKQNPHTRRWETGRGWYKDYLTFMNNNPNITGKHEPINNPKYKANKHKPQSAFFLKKELLKRISMYSKKGSVRKIVYIELKTYKEFVFEDHPFGYNYQIDPNRMVWVVVKKYTEGISTKAGFFENATVVSLYDAETGESFMFSVHGKRTKTKKLPR